MPAFDVLVQQVNQHREHQQRRNQSRPSSRSRKPNGWLAISGSAGGTGSFGMVVSKAVID